MMTLTMMTKAVMIEGMTQVDHPQAGHLNRLNLRLKGDNPDADYRHLLEHNSNPRRAPPRRRQAPTGARSNNVHTSTINF